MTLKFSTLVLASKALPNVPITKEIKPRRTTLNYQPIDFNEGGPHSKISSHDSTKVDKEKKNYKSNASCRTRDGVIYRGGLCLKDVCISQCTCGGCLCVLLMSNWAENPLPNHRFYHDLAHFRLGYLI